jgi:ferrochelatase
MSNKAKGIVLMNLGSPDSTEVKDLKRYLSQFLMDKRVIDYPYIFRKILVDGIIVPSRAPKSAEAYRSIWTKDGSPLIVWTKSLEQALENELHEPVEIGMRYGQPSTENAFKTLSRHAPDLEEVLAIPLYPHYAMSSYETAVEHARETHKKGGYGFTLEFIRPFYNNSEYINALADRVRPFINKSFDHLLFSFHGIPERHLRRADPTKHHCLQSADCCSLPSAAHQTCYRHQCFQTMKLVTEQLQIPREKFSYAFQSRLGREQWLRPYTDFRLQEMPGEGIKKLLVICPAFVSDCLETLEEIEMRGRESFLSAGGEHFEMIPCLNDSKLWIATLAGWIKNYFDGERDMILTR